jgi:1A family penicillin-binding protein
MHIVSILIEGIARILTEIIIIIVRGIIAISQTIARLTQSLSQYLERRFPRFRRLKKRSGRHRIIFRLATLLVLLSAGAIVWILRDLPTVETFEQRIIPQSTRIYDHTGTTLLYDLHGEEKRTIVPLDRISPLLINATITAEDDRFYHHIGIDLPGIIRALFRNILSLRFEEGGSTITQQLVRNAVLTPEKTFARKIREAVLAIAIEIRFSKEKILEAYLNQIPYGSLLYGAEAASQAYFGKSASDLTLAEAATLAALPKAPSYYSPYGNHRDELIHRRNYILDRMVTLGYLDSASAERAKGEPLTVLPPREPIIAPHFVFYVQEELERRFGKERVEQGGLRVITSLDVELQKIADEAVRSGAERNERRFRGRNAALVAIDPKNGNILAMVGSRDYFNPAYDGNVNVTVRPRQPGSSFKPIVYAAAFERGFTPDTILFDLPTEFGTGEKSYRPQNYTGKTYGPVTARQALANSLNIASVKMLWLAGVRESVELAQRLGITTLKDPNEYGLSLVLGGGAVTLLEESSAFGVFANDGIRVEPEAILRVETTDGKVLFSHHPVETRVLDREIAREITDILSDNEARALVFGTQTPLTLGSRPVAAKTGTAQDFRDAWTIGYTPSLVAGVWVGNNDYSPMARGADGSVVAAPIWNTFMREALKEKPIESFPKPKPVVTKKPILDGVWVIETKVRIDRASGKLATDRTPPEWAEERIFREIHDTLYWVDRKNPRGDPPKDPSRDPQYENWEAAVQTWVANDPTLAVSVSEKPPTEFDDIHVREHEPTVRIITPTEGDVALKDGFLLSVEATAPLGIESVTASLDGEIVGTLSKEGESQLFTRFIRPPKPPNDEGDETNVSHLLTVQAFDRYGNRGIASVSLRY